MGEEVFLVLDFNTVCRFCLRSSGALSDLFLQEEGLTPSIPVQVHSLLDIQVNPTDGFPDKLCHRCRFKIEICYEFKEMVLRTHKVLTDNTVQEILYSHTETACNGKKEDEDHIINIKLNTMESSEDRLVSIDENDLISKEDDVLDKSDLQSSFEQESELDYITRSDYMFLIKKDTIGSDETFINLEEEEHTDQEILEETKQKKNKKSNKMDEYPSLFTARRRNQCLLCLEKCDNKDVLNNHIQNHLADTGMEPYYLFGERDLTCNLCQRVFSYRYNFIIHQREHLNLKPFVCKHPDCDQSYSSVYRLRNHSLVHADKKFPCSVCKMKFQRKSDLRAHEIIHIDEGHKFQCSICKLVCKNRRTLRAHVRKHYTTPKFKCDSCPKAYIHRSELERHSHIHSSEKRFRCAACASAYYSRTALLRHEKTHSHTDSVVKKSCPLKACLSRKDNVFETWQGYKDHMENHPAADYPYSCVKCNRGFVTRSSLTKHTVSNCPATLSHDIVIEGTVEGDGSATLVRLVPLGDDDANMEDVFGDTSTDDHQGLLVEKEFVD